MIDEATAEGRSPEAEILFFPVSTRKLVGMSLLTLGFYELFWFYMHWRIYKDRTGAAITPAARSIFAPFFCRALFRHIRDTAVRYGIRSPFNPVLLAVMWIGLGLCAYLPAPFWMVTLLSPFVLAPVQATVNELNRQAAPDHAPNHRITVWNVVGILVGWSLLLLLAVVMSLPESPPQPAAAG